MKDKEVLTTYRCQFQFKGFVKSVVSESGITDLKDGFWIDHDYRFARPPFIQEKGKLNRWYWIPPSKIDFIALDTILSRRDT